jgi:hypothetical protein
VADFRRKLPGLALRDGKGNIPFENGRVIYSSERIQYVEVPHKEFPVFLVADTYLYWCPKFQVPIYGQELMKPGFGMLSRGTRCPFCKEELKPAKVGDKVRIHFRHAKDASWAQWWAEFRE